MVSSSRALPFIWKDPLVIGRRANSFSAHRSHWATSSLLQKTGCRPADRKGSREEKDADEGRGRTEEEKQGGRRMRGLVVGGRGRKKEERQEGGGGGSKKDIEEVKIKGGGDYRNSGGDKEKR